MSTVLTDPVTPSITFGSGILLLFITLISFQNSLSFLLNSFLARESFFRVSSLFLINRSAPLNRAFVRFFMSNNIPCLGDPESLHRKYASRDISTTNLAACVCAKFDKFLPVRFYFVSKRPENFVRIAKFPYAAFGPLFAFHCPLFGTKNNNLGWNRHASPHTGTGATFTGRRYCLRADNRR